MTTYRHLAAIGSSFAAGPGIPPIIDRSAMRSGNGSSIPDVDSATSGLARVVEAVRARAPGARVVLVDYLTVVGPDTRPGPDTPWRAADVAAFARLAEQLVEVFAGAAARTGADLVAVSRPSLDHGLGAAEPWGTGFSPLPRPLSFHPNLAGMQAVAAATHRMLTAPERPPSREARGPGSG